ncbi:MAG: phosphoglycerate kinase [Desulfamplus sp.]|nr:phosphoglycerate kinase [Desulfamplus sp.]
MKSVRDFDVSGKKVMVRVDYNVPMDDHGNITDDNRIRATLPLIGYLIEKKAAIILISHMGRPDGGPVPALSLAPVAQCLGTLAGHEVLFAPDCLGRDVEAKVAALAPGQILLLENLRFHKGEKKNDPDFAKALADLCDIYVNEAFAVSHRKEASVVGIPSFAKSCAPGFLLEKEMQSYRDAMENPRHPLAAVIGGAKVSSKLNALLNMLNVVDSLIIGGAMANTFLKSKGINIGASMVEDDLLDAARDILAKAEKRGIPLLLPVDLIFASALDGGAERRTVKIGKEDVPDGWMALDIGEDTMKLFSDEIKKAGTIVWNGPMGVFEMEAFCEGTMAVARAVAGADGAFSIVGGGDTALAAKVCGVADRVGYISTGGGAFLHLMEGKELPGVAALEYM